MSEVSEIEWTDSTWNVFAGCYQSLARVRELLYRADAAVQGEGHSLRAWHDSAHAVPRSGWSSRCIGVNRGGFSSIV